ncbi:MAG TPA: sulfatase [Myxococcota bacterium]|nr:sulfatase [Myxococcota bacterium]
MLTSVLLACGNDEPPAQARPDILVVVMDTVRADHLGAYGSDNATPIFDAFAQSAVVFEDVTGSSWTWPSHASLFTGEPPWVHGAHFTDAEGIDLAEGWLHVSPMRADLPTLAERLTAAGYRTVALSGNKLLSPEFGLTRGFETVEVFYNRDDKVLQRANAVLGEEDPRPLLLFVNLYAAHAPWEARQDTQYLREELAGAEWAHPWVVQDMAIAPHMGRGGSGGDLAEMWLNGELEIPPEGWDLVNQLYDGEVRHVDRELGALLGSWAGTGHTGVVAVTSDHGEYLSERDMILHCRTLYPEVTRVPLALRAQPELPAALRVSMPVNLRELHDALLLLAGVEDRSRLIASVHGEARPEPITARAWRDRTWAEHIGGVYAQGYRLFRDQDDVLILADDGTAELYDLGSDPGMGADLAAELPHRVTRLATEATGAFPESETGLLQVDEATRKQLQQMGYLSEE